MSDPIPYDDDDPMPFGKYGPKPKGEGRMISGVPASYLAWLKDNGCSDPRLLAYIETNWCVIKSELPDRIDD